MVEHPAFNRGVVGSRPTRPTPQRVGPPSSSGLGHHPFKVATRIRTPLGAQEDHHAWSRGAAWLCSPPCQGGGRGFKSRRDRSDRGHAPRSPGQVAQSVERAAENRKVGGSIPSLPTTSAQVNGLAHLASRGTVLQIEASLSRRPPSRLAASDNLGPHCAGVRSIGTDPSCSAVRNWTSAPRVSQLVPLRGLS